MTENEFDYKKYLTIIYNKKVPFAITALAVMTLAVIWSFCLPRVYEAKSTIFIEKSVISELVTGMALSPSVDSEIRFLNSAMLSRSVLLKVFDDLHMNVNRQNPASMEDLVNYYKTSTKIDIGDTVGNSGGSKGLFVVSFKGENPKFVADYVNALVKRYVEENVSAKREASSGASRFFSNEIQDYRDQYNKAEEALNEFKREHPELAATDAGTILGEINDLQERLGNARVRREQLEALQSFNRHDNPLRDRLFSLQKRLGELQVQYTDSYPEVIKTKEEIEEIKSQLSSGRGEKYTIPDPKETGRIGIELRGARAEEANISSLLASRRSLLHSIPSVKAKLGALERDRDAKANQYQELASRQKKSEFTNEVEIQDKAMTFRVIDPAVVPAKPVSPDRVKIIFTGIWIALAVGLGIVLLLEFTDRSVKTVSSLKTLGLPVLAVIPRIENEQVLRDKREKDARVYTYAGLYFSLILMVLLMEVFRVPYLDSMIDNLTGMNILDNIINSVKKIFF